MVHDKDFHYIPDEENGLSDIATHAVTTLAKLQVYTLEQYYEYSNKPEISHECHQYTRRVGSFILI